MRPATTLPQPSSFPHTPDPTSVPGIVSCLCTVYGFNYTIRSHPHSIKYTPAHSLCIKSWLLLPGSIHRPLHHSINKIWLGTSLGCSQSSLASPYCRICQMTCIKIRDDIPLAGIGHPIQVVITTIPPHKRHPNPSLSNLFPTAPPSSHWKYNNGPPRPNAAMTTVCSDWSHLFGLISACTLKKSINFKEKKWLLFLAINYPDSLIF